MTLTWLLKVNREGSNPRPNKEPILWIQFSDLQFIEINSSSKSDGQEHWLLSLWGPVIRHWAVGGKRRKKNKWLLRRLILLLRASRLSKLGRHFLIKTGLHEHGVLTSKIHLFSVFYSEITGYSFRIFIVLCYIFYTLYIRISLKTIIAARDLLHKWHS